MMGNLNSIGKKTYLHTLNYGNVHTMNHVCVW